MFQASANSKGFAAGMLCDSLQTAAPLHFAWQFH
jgi:hypothetical protein